jgi:hypothetical protein
MGIVSGITIIFVSSIVAMWLNDNFNFGGSIGDEVAGP